MSERSLRRSPALIIALLFVFMLINFADKAALGLVAVPLMRDLQLSPNQFGLVAGSFFALFALSGIGFGFAANRIASKPLILLLAFIWAIAQFPLAIGAISLPVLIACRVVLGAGEGPAYPLALHACYKWVPDHRRNVPTAIIMQGGQVGMLIAGPVVTALTIHFGWRTAFLALGCASVVWLVLWQLFAAEGPLDEPALAQGSRAAAPVASLPYRRLLLDPTYLGNVVVYWSAYWVVALIFTWIPAYLQKGLHFGASESGWMFSLFIAINIPIILLGSWISETMLRRGVGSRVSRGVLTAGCTLAGALLIVIALRFGLDRMTRTVLLAVGCSLPQITFVLCSAVTGEITPARQRGAALAIANSLATTAGLIAPISMGRFVSATEGIVGYENGLMFAAGVLAVGGVVSLVAVNPARSRARLELAQTAGTATHSDTPHPQALQ
ncbi:MFS transporter [Paraburkholderia acidisoli]|uniref:MFS transporter n=1 Tax=Paraburkholderia acidisoli TaxID=2571748 RepID=A0A7Z2GMS1_9BURK|nr:MFS transporter [Paraburkholderia acidisoli]QGZ64264.1 MFS transporter [Paraburkholderia acidisoli]